MSDPAMATLSGLPCPACGERALGGSGARGPGPSPVTCGACSARLDAVGDVTVLTDEARLVGGCCAGFRQHLVRWRARDGFEGETAFETWPQDCVRLSRGDRVSLLFPAGRAEPRGRRARPPMPLMVADHTTGTIWSLVGSVPVRTLRDPG